MAPSKRKEALSSPQRQAKVSKKDPKAEHRTQQLHEVSLALKKASLKPDVHKMLQSGIEYSLGEFSDKRHPYQHEAVQAVAVVLAEVEASLHKAVEDARAESNATAGLKAQYEQEYQTGASKRKSKEAEAQQFKVVLAAKAFAFRAATASVEAAAEAKSMEGKKAQEAAKKQHGLEVGLENLKFLAAALPEEAGAPEKRGTLMALLKKYPFEESMITALTVSLAKAPEARGHFDLVVVTELEGELTKLLVAQREVISAAAPIQEKCDAVLKQAQDHLDNTRTEQRAAARDFDAALEELASCESSDTEAQKASRDITRLCKQLDKSLHNAEVEVELFEQGPREAFKELRERTTPLPTADEDEQATMPGVSDIPMADVPVASC